MIQLEQLVKENLPKEKEGKVASYIPALAEVNPKQLGVALYDLEDGEIGEAGQSEVRFAIESISKVITLMLAIKSWEFKKYLNMLVLVKPVLLLTQYLIWKLKEQSIH